MTKETDLPDDVDALKALLSEQFFHNEKLQLENTRLQEQLNLAIARRYAASSEKIPADQFRLFDEAENEALASESEVEATINNPAAS